MKEKEKSTDVRRNVIHDGDGDERTNVMEWRGADQSLSDCRRCVLYCCRYHYYYY